MYKISLALAFIILSFSYTHGSYAAEATGSISTGTGEVTVVITGGGGGGGGGGAGSSIGLRVFDSSQFTLVSDLINTEDTGEEEEDETLADPRKTEDFVGKEFYLTVNKKTKSEGKSKKKKVDVKATVISEDETRVKVQYKDPRTKKLKTKWVAKTSLHKTKKKSR